MISTDPAVPTMAGIIKIFYDSSKDAGDLHNFTGDLYAHTGVYLEGTSGWQRVIGTWGNNTTQPKLRYLGNYLYELDITPDTRTFYSLSQNDVVTKICLVLRNASASLQTRPDIFIDIFKSGLNIKFSLPATSSFIAELNDDIPLKADASNADSVSLFINKKYIKKGISPDLLTDTISARQYGDLWVKAVAWDLPAFAADSFFVYVREQVTVEPLPAGIKDGINYTGTSSVTLVLHAPYKNYVFVTGDFTNWRACETGYMKRTPDNERYWMKIEGLKPGKEYRFQYFVDNELYIADPYADKVLDPWNDLFITDQTYPGLIAYPKDTASGMVAVLQTSQTPYSWKTTRFTPPEIPDLIIYELLIRDFIADHDFKTLTDTLDYLDNLGINAIELMPVSEFEGNSSWGYNPSFYFAPDKYYGPKNDMKMFIDSCHKRGIAVIMDIVLNHSSGQSPFVQLYLDHYGTDEIIMKSPNPWFNTSSPNSSYKFGADFNHESTSTQKLVDRVTSYWLTEYKIDGFRFDFTKGFTNTTGEGTPYDASRIAILKRMADKVWAVNPEAYVILEHFCADAEEKELAGYGLLLWGNKNYDYCEAAMGYSSDFTTASYQGRGWSVPNLVTYMESHDEERLMYKTLTWGSSSGDYNTMDQKTALKRMQLDALFFLTIPGPKMIWQFGELGYDVSINYGGRTSEKPIRWNYRNDEDRHRLFLTYKFLNNLKKTEPSLRKGTFTYSLSSSLKRIQLSDPSLNINILGNFGLTGASIDPAFAAAGLWYEYFTGNILKVINPNDQLSLKPGEFRLYSTKKLASSDLITGIEDQISSTEKPGIKIYPNPFSEETLITIADTERAGNYNIGIFSMFGYPVRTIYVPAGSNQVIWDGKTAKGGEASKGIYFLRISDSRNNTVMKIIKQ
jgi:1,4-alpha-glucan branching enzyme